LKNEFEQITFSDFTNEKILLTIFKCQNKCF
jgi:hypothetical protein